MVEEFVQENVNGQMNNNDFTFSFAKQYAQLPRCSNNLYEKAKRILYNQIDHNYVLPEKCCVVKCTECTLNTRTQFIMSVNMRRRFRLQFINDTCRNVHSIFR